MADPWLQQEYRRRIAQAFQFIDGNLDAKLSLEEVSAIAAFSPYHFHRLFKQITGETLNSFVFRRRVETAAAALLHKPSLTITDISLQNGFSSNSSLTRAFKKHYGLNPTQFREENPLKYERIRSLKSKIGQDYPSYDQYLCAIDELKQWMQMNANIQVKQIPSQLVAKLTTIGAHSLGQAFERLIAWAAPRGLMGEDAKLMTVYYDSFKVTEASKVRMSACIALEQPMEVDGEMSLATIPAGKCIVGSYEIVPAEFEKAWTGLFVWMNEQGYQKAEENPFEVYHNDFRQHPEGKCRVDFHIPIC